MATSPAAHPFGRQPGRLYPAALLAGLVLGWAIGWAMGGPAAPTPVRAATPAALQARPSELPPWAAALSGRNLKPGDRGPHVVALQRLLVAIGYSPGIDGVYSSDTAGSVQAFQRRSGLAPDGLAGPLTLRRLLEWSWWYPVRTGDTLEGVARLYGTDVGTLRRLNGLRTSRILAGQRLLVPRAGAGGSVQEWGRYVVQPGDTLWSIASRFSVSVADLQRLNGLLQPSSLRAGQHLWLPSRWPGGSAGSQERIGWPVSGAVTSGFGWRPSPFGGGREFHEGIDIAVPEGTPVRAAAPGTVVEAGWMDAFGYGVVIDHGGGLQTLYGHNRKLAVRAGQRVRRGQIIAWSGSTGRSTGPHLDFRVKVNGQAVDPLQVLGPP